MPGLLPPVSRKAWPMPLRKLGRRGHSTEVPFPLLAWLLASPVSTAHTAGPRVRPGPYPTPTSTRSHLAVPSQSLRAPAWPSETHEQCSRVIQCFYFPSVTNPICPLPAIDVEPFALSSTLRGERPVVQEKPRPIDAGQAAAGRQAARI